MSPTAPSSAASPDPPPLPVLPVPYAPGPVGGCLHFYWQNWQAIQAKEWVISILRDGYFLPFDSAPPLTADPPCLSYSATHPLFQDVSPHTATTGQAGYRGDSTLDPRFLQPNLPRTQEIRRLQARHQPQRPQQVPTLSTLPHGDARLYHAFTTARSLGHLAGLQGCLLSRPSCTHTSTLPQLPVRSPLIPVPGPPFRSGDVSVPLHSPSQGSRDLCQEPGPLLTPLSG